MDDLKRRVGRAVSRLRRAAGLSQAELAARLGWPKATLVGYEHGRRQPPLNAVVELATALGARPGQIVDDAEKDNG